MARLKGLIKYHQWQVDEKRRDLARLEGELATLIHHIEQLDIEEAREIRLAKSKESLEILGRYRLAVEAKRKTLLAERAKKESECEAQRDKVAAAFKELKSFEIAQQQADAREAKEQARREQAALDEQALRQSQN